MPRSRAVCALLCLLTLPAAAEGADAPLPDGAGRVASLSITGLKRTKPRVVEPLLARFIGRAAEEIDLNEVFAVIKETDVLEPLSAEIGPGENGAVLRITVREKLAFFPVPFAMAGSGGWSAGAAVMDANAFGLRDTAMAVGMYGGDGWVAGAMYARKARGAGSAGWDASIFCVSSDREDTDQAERRVLRRFSALSINPRAGASYALTGWAEAGAGVSYRYIAPEAGARPLAAPDAPLRALSFAPSISVKTSSWDGFFLSETSASLRYEYTAVFGGADAQTVSFRGAWNRPLVPGLRIISKAGAAANIASGPFFEASPADAAVNILSARFSARHIAGISAGLEQYLRKFSFGTLSVSASYQAAYSWGDNLGHQGDHGVCAMAQLYFSKIAVPGMGLGASYNVGRRYPQFSFAVGMTW